MYVTTGTVAYARCVYYQCVNQRRLYWRDKGRLSALIHGIITRVFYASSKIQEKFNNKRFLIGNDKTLCEFWTKHAFAKAKVRHYSTRNGEREREGGGGGTL